MLAYFREVNYLITAIGTDSGKTLVSAIITEALKADYWKPVQSGLPRDTDTVTSLVSNAETVFHAERHLLKTPASPHAAAKIDEVQIQLDDFTLPRTDRDLVVEGAGGMLVPLNDEDYVIDFASALDLEIVLVSNLYLGSINHTLLSIEALKNRGLKVKGIIFNGPSNPESERVIEKKSGWPVLLRIPQLDIVNKETVQRLSEELLINW